MSEDNIVEFITEKIAIANLTNYDLEDRAQSTPDSPTIQFRFIRKNTKKMNEVFVELWNATNNIMLYGGFECKISQLANKLTGKRNELIFVMMIEALGGDSEGGFDSLRNGNKLKDRILRICTEVYREWTKISSSDPTGLPDFDADLPVEIPLFGFKILPDDTEILTEGFWAMKDGSPNLYVYLSKLSKNMQSDLIFKEEENFEILPFQENSIYMFDLAILPPPYTQEWLVSPKTFKTIDDEINPEMGKELFQEIYNILIPKHIWMETQSERKVLAYWILASYFYDVFDAFPIGHGFGYYGSGKSRLAMLIVALAYHGQFAVNLSSSDLFRTKEEFKPTFVIDENEENLRDAITIKDDMINGSYVRGAGSVSRRREVETPEGKIYVRDTFDLYSPTFFCSISPMRTPASRSRVITFSMLKRDINVPIAERRRYKQFEAKMYEYRFKMWSSVRKIYNILNIEGIPEYTDEEKTIKAVGRDHELWLPIFTMMKIINRWDEDYNDVMEHLEWNKQYRLDADMADEERPTLYAALSKLWWEVSSKGYESPKDINDDEDERWWYRHPNDDDDIWEFKFSDLIKVMKALAKETGYSKDINHKTVSNSLAMLNFGRNRTGKKRNATFFFNINTFSDTVYSHLGISIEELGRKDYDVSIAEIKRSNGNSENSDWTKK